MSQSVLNAISVLQSQAANYSFLFHFLSSHTKISILDVIDDDP